MKNEGVCQVRKIHKNKISKVKKMMMNNDIIAELSHVFKTLGDETRIKILYALSKSELCVCDLSAVLEMSISAVSHQLRILRNMRLVKYRKEGRMVYYSLDDEHIVQLIKVSYEHILEQKRG